MGRIIRWESLIERDAIYLLEYDRAVKSYEEQPNPIFYVLDGKRHRYTPDFRVERNGQYQIVEVKPAKQVVTGKYDDLFREVAWECQSMGCQFVLATDEIIRAEPKLQNIKMLYRYARTPLRQGYQSLIDQFFNAEAVTTIDGLARFFAERGIEDSIQVVYALVYHGFFEIDLNTVISSLTEIGLPDS